MFKLIIEGLFLLFDTTKIQSYFNVCKCAYVYFRIKVKFFCRENWAQIGLAYASKSLFIPFILLLLLLCNIVFYGNIVNTRNKGEIETREGTTVGPSESRW